MTMARGRGRRLLAAEHDDGLHRMTRIPAQAPSLKPVITGLDPVIL
jgi:hypothetical protein